MSPTSMRAAAGLLAGGLALASLTGCTFSSNNVDCSGSSCSVTLRGEGAEADVLGTRISFGGTADGRASLRVGGTSVSCAEGENVSAGPVRLECTTVNDDAVTLTASLG
jgi:hypothetical protein